MGLTENKRTLLEDLIDRAGGCAVVDGGFATQLETHGAAINDPLWSALCLIKDPDLIRKVHLEYLEAGADVLVTSSYQATLPGFLSRGLSLEEGEFLLKKSVKLAAEARDEFWDAVETNSDHRYNRALVAASIGSYGAYLADGSEYSGYYGADVTLEKLKDFHRRRIQVLVEAGADLLAFETIPNRLEAQARAMSSSLAKGILSVDRMDAETPYCFKKACVELLEEENINIPSWICFTSVNGENAPCGESFQECLEVINKSSRVHAVGINCAPPQFVESLISKFRQLTKKLIVVYPNSGEVWDGRAKRWLPSTCFNDDKFELFATRWHDMGASLIGGCCRTTPSTVEAISKALKQRLSHVADDQ